MLLHEIWDNFCTEYIESFIGLPTHWKSKCGKHTIDVVDVCAGVYNTIINNKSVAIDTCQGIRMDIYQDNEMNYSLYIHTQKIYGVNYFHLIDYTKVSIIHHYNNYHIANMISWIEENFEPDPPF